MALLLGIDLGSSAIKVCLFDGNTQRVLASAQSPRDAEMPISSPQEAWAEQDPSMWWHHLELAMAELAISHPLADVIAIGIGYQMHGLVLLDKAGDVLRPSIIWCDSRAVTIGRRAEKALGQDYLATHTLNSPGNFTAAKLAWVARHEPAVLAKAHTAMLPGDYLAFKLSGQRYTTCSGLSEMILWDFSKQMIASEVLTALQLDASLLPERLPSFSEQGEVLPHWCKKFGFRQNPRLTYRGGDQPNNAYALNVLQPGEVAASAGTSGVIYAVTDQRHFDQEQRINSFLHVNHLPEAERLGLLFCLNGTGSAFAWLRRMLSIEGRAIAYEQMNSWAQQAAVGGSGLRFYPFGNGAERLLKNGAPGARLEGLQFATHGAPQLCAALQDGIAASLAYGMQLMETLGSKTTVVRAGRANLFLSDRFCLAFAQLTGVRLELFATDGAQGAARAAGQGAGLYTSAQEALHQLEAAGSFAPDPKLASAYDDFYARWRAGMR